MVLKRRGLNVRLFDFLTVMRVDRKEFFKSYKRVITFYPDFQKRDKKNNSD